VGSMLVRLAMPETSELTTNAQCPTEVGPCHLPHQGDPGWKLSRLMLLTPEDSAHIWESELKELQRFRETALEQGDTELLPSATAAAELLQRQRKERLASRTIVASPEMPAAAGTRCSRASSGASDVMCQEGELLPPCAMALLQQHEGGARDDAQIEQIGHDHDEDADSLPVTPTMSAQLEAACILSPSGVSPQSPSLQPSISRSISFFQAQDGRPIFLQPFFTKLLLHEHGRWDRLPAQLPELRIERIHEETVSQETRKRHKFLQHLPLGSTFSFAEVDLRSFLSKETREHFADDFMKRRQQQKKDQARTKHQERISKARAAEDEERFYSSLNLAPVVNQVLPTKEDFAVPLPGRSDEEVLITGSEVLEAGQAEGSGDPGGEDAPTLADKIKEKMASKKRQEQQARKQQCYFPEVGGNIGAISGSASSSWGPGLGSSRATGWGKKDAVGGVDAPTTKASPCQFEERATFGSALEAALKRSSAPSETGGVNAASSRAVQDTEEVGQASAGKKKRGKAKPTAIRLFG